MNSYSNLTNWFTYRIVISQSVYEFDTLVIENVDFAHSFWNADERAHHATMIINDLAISINEPDCIYEVVWTDAVMTELNELADEINVIPYKALALEIRLNNLGLQYFAPDMLEYVVELGELVETAGDQITLKDDCVFYTGYMGYTECVGDVITPSVNTLMPLDYVYPQLPTLIIQTYKYQNHLSHYIHIVYCVYNNKVAPYAYLTDNISECGKRALSIHKGNNLYNVTCITSVTIVSAKIFSDMLANPLNYILA